MNTLHEHLREMLHAIDKQKKIPHTRIFGALWLAYDGINCTMCAAGAWYAEHYGRRPFSHLDDLDGPIRDAMLIMDSLRVFDIQQAHYRLYGRDIVVEGLDIYSGNAIKMGDDWRAAMDELLRWLTANNL